VPINDLSREIDIDLHQLIDDKDIPKPYIFKNDIVM